MLELLPIWLLGTGIIVLSYSSFRQVKRIERLERVVFCHHCWHWTMTSPSRMRTWQHCCKCGVVLAVFGDPEPQAEGARSHGPYLIISPGMELLARATGGGNVN